MRVVMCAVGCVATMPQSLYVAAIACAVGCVVGCVVGCAAACAADGSMSAWHRRQTDGDRRRRQTLGAWFLLEAQARDGGGEAAAAVAGGCWRSFRETAACRE